MTQFLCLRVLRCVFAGACLGMSAAHPADCMEKYAVTVRDLTKLTGDEHPIVDKLSGTYVRDNDAYKLGTAATFKKNGDGLWEFHMTTEAGKGVPHQIPYLSAQPCPTSLVVGSEPSMVVFVHTPVPPSCGLSYMVTLVTTPTDGGASGYFIKDAVVNARYAWNGEKGFYEYQYKTAEEKAPKVSAIGRDPHNEGDWSFAIVLSVMLAKSDAPAIETPLRVVWPSAAGRLCPNEDDWVDLPLPDYSLKLSIHIKEDTWPSWLWGLILTAVVTVVGSLIYVFFFRSPGEAAPAQAGAGAPQAAGIQLTPMAGS